VRGLTLGALLGAIIAGSSMWRRSKAARLTVRTPASTAPTPEPTDALPAGAPAPATAATTDEVARP
jgi:hypothetical protein